MMTVRLLALLKCLRTPRSNSRTKQGPSTSWKNSSRDKYASVFAPGEVTRSNTSPRWTSGSEAKNCFYRSRECLHWSTWSWPMRERCIGCSSSHSQLGSLSPLLIAVPWIDDKRYSLSIMLSLRYREVKPLFKVCTGSYNSKTRSQLWAARHQPTVRHNNIKILSAVTWRTTNTYRTVTVCSTHHRLDRTRFNPKI